MKKLAFSGSHGTGKSTSVFKLAHELKFEFPSNTVGILMENAKHSPFKINKETTSESQIWIYSNQLQQELYLSVNYDFLVTDRTIIDAIAYTKVVGLNDLSRDLLNLSLHHISSYDKIYFKLIKNNDYLIHDGVRDSQDVVYRQDVEDIMIDLYDQISKKINLNIEYI